MKAYRAFTDFNDRHEIVFAETASKARSTALGLDGVSDAEFIEIKIARCKGFDQFFDGKCLYLNYNNIDVQKASREVGWWFGDGSASCGCCGLYQYDDLPESIVEETDEGDLCQECINN